jgi:hypothetical protein
MYHVAIFRTSTLPFGTSETNHGSTMVVAHFSELLPVRLASIYDILGSD